MLKNITWGNLFTSKTFWGAVFAVVAEAAKALFPQSAGAAMIVQAIAAILAAIGLIDRTATPNAGK